MKIKNVLFGITGSISSYKILDCIRQLKKKSSDLNIKVIMTKSACKFIQPLSFEALSGNRVYVDTFEILDSPMEHIELVKWADQIIIAPASANFISKIANGIADDLLSTLMLVNNNNKNTVIVPSMNVNMWQNSIIKGNVHKLKSHKYKFLGPRSGSQACGDNGYGRMVEPHEIIDYVLIKKLDKKYKGKVLITAGPTIEPIDPVRYISNHSSGKMGYALAKVFANYGADVLLVLGQTNIAKPEGVNIIDVTTAEEMYSCVKSNLAKTDIFIAAAAVCDYKVESYSNNKIKKNNLEDSLSLSMKKNPDILAYVGKKNDHIYTVGFAAETSDGEKFANEKLNSKSANMIILNNIDINSGFPFYNDQNKISIFLDKEKDPIVYPKLSKSQLSIHIADHIIDQIEMTNKIELV